MSTPPAVAVITVSYNSGESLEEFLASIAQAGGDARVIVADNDSPDPGDLESVVARHGAELQRMPRNLGYGGAVDEAATTVPVEVPYLLVANPDVTFHPGSLARMLEAADAHPEAGTIGPRIVDADGTTYPSARRLPSLRVGTGHALFGTVWPANPWTRSYRQERAEDGERAAGWLSGACVLIRRSAFEQLGGFDTAYFMYFEDVDLGARMTKAGWTNLYIPSATVTHTGAHSTRLHQSAMDRVHHQSAYRYLARRYHQWYLGPLRLALRVGIAARERVLSRA